MTRVRVWIVAMLLAVPAVLGSPGLAAAQEAKQANLENTLWDVDQQWLCDGPYQKPYAECVKFRSQYWVDGFFEVQSGGTLRNKEEMVATQSAANPAPPHLSATQMWPALSMATPPVEPNTLPGGN